MSTTKLTRKEIIGEDPIHDALVSAIETIRERGKVIALVVLSAAFLGVGVYLALEYLKTRDMAAQQQLSRGMDFFHGRTDPTASEDPYGKGLEPLFRSDEARYQAASKEFSSVIDKHGSSKLGVIARYYLGLCQVRLGQKAEATRTLEAVRNNTKDRTVGYLGKKVLARLYMDSGNYKGAQEILNGMIKDPQCELPKDDLKLELSRTYDSQGKRDEAIKILRGARDDASKSTLQSLLIQELDRLERGSNTRLDSVKPNSIRP